MMPRIDLTSVPSSGTVLEFSMAHAQYATTRNENLKVQVSVDCGLTWTTIYTKSGSTLATAPVTTGDFSPAASQWRKESVSLTPYIGQQAMFVFIIQAANGNNIYIDDVNVKATGVSIAENDLDTYISVFPNPVKEKLGIFSSSDILKSSVISLRNSLGEEVVKIKNENQDQAELNVSQYPNGVYFLSIQSEAGSAVKKIIITK